MRRSAGRKTIIAACAVSVIGGATGATATPAQEPCIQIDGINDRCPTWAATHASTALAEDVPGQVLAAPDGSAVFAYGYGYTATGGLDWVLVAHDPGAGATLWSASHGAPDAAEIPTGLAIDPSSDVLFAAGYTCATVSDVDSCDITVVAVDAASGSTRWTAAIDGPAGGLDATGDVVVSPDGSTVLVTGLQTSASTGADAAVVALAADTGAIRWEARYDGVGGFDAGHWIAVSADGERVFATGPSDGALGVDWATTAYDVRTGERLWTARRDDHGGEDTPMGIVAVGSRVVVTGNTDDGAGAASANFATVAYDQVSGAQAWSAQYDAGMADMPLGVAAAPDGDGVFVSGMGRAPTGGYDIATVGYDAVDGRERWAATYNGPANDGDTVWDIAVSPDGDRVFIGGDTVLTAGIDYAHLVAAYDAGDGSLEWTGLHRGAGPRGGSMRQGIDVSPDGTKVYFSGRVLQPTTDVDFLTLAYATG